MSQAEKSITLPIKRVTGETLRDRLTENAYERILPARYLRKDENGEIVESPEDLFKRVAKNIALAEAVYEADKRGKTLYATPQQVKPNHSNREKLVSEVFGDGVSLEDDVEVELTEKNINKFAYDTIVPELDDEIRETVVEAKDKFQGMMEELKFTPNSPTLMNAGDKLQQLSACFVMSPEDDMESIHETAKEAALVFQSGGGVGYAFWRLRPYGDPVGSTGGIASGPMTFMETYDQLCETIAQGGTRRGAQMGVMRVSHPDVIYFIHSKNKDVSLAHTLRLNDPDDYTHSSFSEALEEARDLIDEEGRVPKHLRNAAEGHLSNFNISVGITDGFMDALYNDEEFTFTNPRTGEPHIATQHTKEMYGWFGLDDYVEVGEPLSVPAREIWDRIIEGAWENGEPGVIYLERANKEHSFDTGKHEDHRILATNPCVTGDTLISTENGLVPAEELYEQGVARDVVVDGRLSEDTVKEASSVYRTGEKDVYRLTTKEGYELRLTADHRVMTDEGWVEAQDLEPGDAVHILNRKGKFGQHGSLEEGRVLGWLVGDGHLKHGEERAVLNFYDEDAEISDQFAEYVNEVVREPIGNADYEISANEISRSDDYRGPKAVEQRIRSTRLYEIAEQTGLVENKLQVPDAVMRGSEEMAQGFLQALFTADGSVQFSPSGSRSIRLSSIKKSLLKDVQRLLLNFGIASRIYENRKKGGERELPDGRGGKKLYEAQPYHELLISRENLLTYSKEIGFLRSDKSEALDEIIDSYKYGPNKETFKATVDTVEHDGIEQVYDLTEPDTHSFTANGLIVHNCGEQPLEEYEACNLGHINLSTVVADNAPDWRVWYVENGDNYDDLETAVDAFLQEAVDWDEFDDRIEWGTRFLENVVTMSDFPIDKIEETVSEMRKIGLGIMGLAQLYIQMGVTYGTDVGNEIARQLMRHINHGSKWTSHKLAKERGVFGEWEKSKYANPTEYREWFEHQTGLNADEWKGGFPIRNHNTTTIAPTGTTSMIANTTGGCEPIYNVAYYKNVSDDVQGDEMLVEFDDYFLRVLQANDINVEKVKKEAQEQMENNEFEGVEGLESVPDEIGELFVTTSDLSGKEHAAVQCACQEGVDSSISKTCNFPNEATKEDMDEVYRYIYENGGKGVTVYRDGTRSKQVLTTRAKNKEMADEADVAEMARDLVEEGELEVEDIVPEGYEIGVSDDQRASPGDLEPRPRPDTITGVTQKIDTGYGGLFVTVNEDEEGLFEVFAQIGKSGGYTASFTEAIARLISLCLRSGVPPEQIIDQLEGIRSPRVSFDRGQQIHSVPDGIAKAMERYMNGEVGTKQSKLPVEEGVEDLNEGTTIDDESDKEVSDFKRLVKNGMSPECPDCGHTLTYTEGCVKCTECGYSEC